MEVAAPIRVIPSELFLGTVLPGHSSQRTILLWYQRDHDAHPGGRMRIQHDLSEEFQVTWGVARGEYWEVRAEFSALRERRPGFIEGTVFLEDTLRQLPTLRVPVKLLVEDSGDGIPSSSR